MLSGMSLICHATGRPRFSDVFDMFETCKTCRRQQAMGRFSVS
jgi:hypothetical protein